MVKLRRTKHLGYVAYDKSPRFFREPNVKFELAMVIALPVESSMFNVPKYNYFHCLIENNKKMFSNRETFKKQLLKEILLNAVM